MSVALDWTQGAPAAPAGVRHGHLTLVPPLTEAPAAAGGLTRRGRLLRTLLVFTVLMVGVLHLVDPAPAQPDLTVHHTAIVLPGQTLSEIAHRELPAVSVEEGIRRIQLVNGLPNTALAAGQVLAIPVNR